MFLKFILILNWTLWSGLIIALLYALVTILTERNDRPEAGPVLGVFLVGVGLLFSAATAALLYWLTQRQSVTGMVLMTLLLAWPLVPLIARPIGMAIKDWKCAQAKAGRENATTP